MLAFATVTANIIEKYDSFQLVMFPPHEGLAVTLLDCLFLLLVPPLEGRKLTGVFAIMWTYKI